MSDLHKALSDIHVIRQQLAAGTVFRGFGPRIIAVTGVLALVTASAQSIWFEALAGEPAPFVVGWVVTAVVSATLIGVSAMTRSRRQHSGLADAMILNAAENFLPAGLAGAALALVLMRVAPDTTWMLPGLWQILVSLGIFASVRFLPRAVMIAGGWYFVAGITVLMLGSEARALSPWAMGVPFAIGQILFAVILHRALGGDDAQD
jgi:hypothetical protein